MTTATAVPATTSPACVHAFLPGLRLLGVVRAGIYTRFDALSALRGGLFSFVDGVAIRHLMALPFPVACAHRVHLHLGSSGSPVRRIWIFIGYGTERLAHTLETATVPVHGLPGRYIPVLLCLGFLDRTPLVEARMVWRPPFTVRASWTLDLSLRTSSSTTTFWRFCTLLPPRKEFVNEMSRRGDLHRGSPPGNGYWRISVEPVPVSQLK